jgi:2-polyprenyl-3-methyl-5-hydroxy-6-metoxy-1,4-benzoquinol methylase
LIDLGAVDEQSKGLRDLERQKTHPERCQNDDPENFYRSLWASGSWGAAEPNDDETSRLAEIVDLLESCDLVETPRILDLGCGRGWLSHTLSEYGDVLGTDIVAASVERARELFPTLSFEQTDLRGLQETHGRESFDLVVSSEVLEHVEADEKRDFLQAIKQLLRPGGYAIITTPRGELERLWEESSDWQQPVEDWISETELDTLAVSVGFRVERRTRAHVYGITPLSRVLASRYFRLVTRILPVLERLTYASRIYQVVLLRRPR